MAMTTTQTLRGDQVPDGPSDTTLLHRVRQGDSDAYGDLYVRHEPAATSLARYLTRSNHQADDVVADAFARVLRAIKGGAGPSESFRPYLLTAVRRTVWRHAEESNHHRLAASEDEAELLDLRLAVEPEDRTDEGIILRAFQELPERWQLVLWHTEIEGQPPAAVAPLLGLSPNATAALAVRAREGLRQAFLQAHLQSRPADSCRFSVEHLGSFVRDGLGKRDNAKVEAHLADCDECRELQADLGSLNKALRSIVGPAVVGAGALRWLQNRAAESAGGVGTLEHARQVVHRLRFPQAVGLAGAAAALFVALGVSSDLGRPPPPAEATARAVLIDVVVPNQVIDAALTGTNPHGRHDVQQRSCAGASLPLSLPEGSTPTGAALAEADGAGTEPSVVDPDTATRFTAVPGDGAILVGDGGACVTNLIQPLVEAPDDTALVVSFLDPVGDLQILVVPQIVDVVQDALAAAVALVETTDQQLHDYLLAISGQLPGGVLGPDGVGGAVPGGGSDPSPLPTLPAGGGTPSLPSLPPVVHDGGGGFDDTVGSVDDVTDTVCGLLGCP